jgi:hypothetical protein
MAVASVGPSLKGGDHIAICTADSRSPGSRRGDPFVCSSFFLCSNDEEAGSDDEMEENLHQLRTLWLSLFCEIRHLHPRAAKVYNKAADISYYLLTPSSSQAVL